MCSESSTVTQSSGVSNSFDVAIVGAGIVGLAHAWRAAARGLKVVVFERSSVACGASIRNFGMVWPVGQPFGRPHQIAMNSRALWLELASRSSVWATECGSLHLAHRPDEWAVLSEFNKLANQNDVETKLLTPEQVHQRTDAANADGLIGALWSPTELCVNPRDAIRQTAEYLQSLPNVELHFDTTIISVDASQLTASDARHWNADKTIVCGGADFETLFPTEFRKASLRKTKLQMFRTVAQPNDWRLGPHLASGLTLRHYKSFEACPSIGELQQRVAHETPELDQFGIHVMASQHDSGHVVLGDSHEYDDDILPFDQNKIESLMIRELQKQFKLPDWSIESRWNGCYAKHPTDPLTRLQPQPNVTICISPGGAGMTLSFGWAEEYWKGVADGFRI